MHFSFVLQGWEIQKCSRSRSQVPLPVWSAHCGAGLVPPLFVCRDPMTHLHEKLLHEKRRHLVRAARSDGHFNRLHRPQNKTSITGWAFQPMGGPWWEKTYQKSRSSSSATCRTWPNTKPYLSADITVKPFDEPTRRVSSDILVVCLSSLEPKWKSKSLLRFDKQKNRHQTP
jgi:hypothetical protein